MENKTIKQLADLLEVSKTAVRNYMDEDFREKYTEKDSKGVFTISPEGCKVVADLLGRTDKLPQKSENQFAESTANQVPGDMVALLQTTIEVLRDQLAAKDQQIADLTATVRSQAESLQAAQALHAGTMQQMLPVAVAASDPEPVDLTAQAAEKAAPEEPEPPKKKSFWQRVFGG